MSHAAEYEQYVIDRLTEIGVRSQKIEPTRAQKTPDLLAEDNEACYLVEVKCRRSDEAIERALQERGVTKWFSHPVGFSAATKTIMRHAVTQLDAMAGNEAFKLIWYYIDAQYNDEDTLIQQVFDTAFGGANLIRMSRLGEAVSVHCFFFHRSVFSTHPQLDGVVVDTGQRFMLLLNPFGQRISAFRETQLFRWFAAGAGGVVEIEQIEREAPGSVLIADCPIDDGRDKHRVLTYLKHKYGLPKWGLFHLPMRHHSAFFAVPAGL